MPSIAWQYRFNEPELGRLREYVPSNKNAVDVGVWWGPWSWWLARRVPRVDSFEANPQLVERLQPVLPLNVHLHSVALSDKTGESNLWVPAGGAGTEGRASLEPGNRASLEWNEQTVTTKRLDDFQLDNVGFVKIDVEGHELSVLKGASDLLASQRPNLLIEIEEHSDRKGELDAIIEFLAGHGYVGRYLLKGSWHPIGELDRAEVREVAERVARHGYITNFVLYARSYVHNFVFIPE